MALDQEYARCWPAPVAQDTATPYLEQEIEDSGSAAQARGDFDATNEADARARIARSIALRQGQPKFRQALLRAYGGRCAISGCAVASVLEAAHIRAYRGEHTNHVQNGLLLRSDLHTLFDQKLITINPATWMVQLAPELRDTDYKVFENRVLRLPAEESWRPSREALARHQYAK